MSFKLNTNVPDPEKQELQSKICDLETVNRHLEAQVRDLETKIRGFLVITKERDALQAEKVKMQAELDWYKKRYPGPGLSG
ncbi:MAG: hypothetical protein ABSG78_13640 [Verrucomicrobiota bacterium]|jgi:hypothetical protein